MRINNINNKIVSIKNVKKKGENISQFELENKTEEIFSIEGVTNITSINSLIALQEFTEKNPNLKQVKRGYEILDELKKLQISIIAGDISENSLKLLKKLLKKTNFDNFDAQLKDILEEIELRAEIELEKIAKFSDSKVK